MYIYNIYGVDLSSRDQISILRTTCAGKADVILSVINNPIWLKRQKDLSRLVGVNDYGTVLCFHQDQGRLYLTKSGVVLYTSKNRIDIYIPESITKKYGIQELVYAYVSGVGLQYIMRDRGYPILHAAVLKIASKIIAFVGDSGQGKSSLAASLIRYVDATMISDDLLVLESTNPPILLTGPEPSIMKVSDEVISGILKEEPLSYPSLPSGKRLYTHSRKSILNESSLKLDAVIWLDRSNSYNKAVIEHIGRSTSYAGLCQYMYHSFGMTSDEKAKEAGELAKMARNDDVRFAVMRYPSGIDQLGSIAQLILAYTEIGIMHERGKCDDK